MFHATLARLVAARESPTADLYFMNACGDFLPGGLQRLGPTVFAGAGACLMMRHDLGAEGMAGEVSGGLSGRLSFGVGGRRLIYFIDDAVEHGASDPALPFLYRQKLRLVERAVSRRVAPRAAAVVVSSPELVRYYAGGPEMHVLHPYWSEPMAGHGHFARILGGDGWLEIAYLGSVVHRADLAFLWPVIGAVLAQHPRVRFHVSERHRLPRALVGHPRIVPIPARDWTVYRAALRGRRFHLALYPLLDTPFNRARSVNKLIEHGVVGAAPIYSDAWPQARLAETAGAGLVVGNCPEEWRDAIESLLARPTAMLALAKDAAALAQSLNQPAPQRRLWARLMEVGLDAAA